jgi:hypothetical protein
MTTSCHQDKGQLILINNSNEIVKFAHVEICEQVVEIENINPHEQAIGNFRITCENHYNITIQFASGKEIKKQTGYVTSGFDFQEDTLSITETDVAIVNSNSISNAGQKPATQ